jgi:hypothetical protein
MSKYASFGVTNSFPTFYPAFLSFPHFEIGFDVAVTPEPIYHKNG